MDQAVTDRLKKECHHRLRLLLTTTLFNGGDVRNIRKLTQRCCLMDSTSLVIDGATNTNMIMVKVT
jgi:hypothetical protein